MTNELQAHAAVKASYEYDDENSEPKAKRATDISPVRHSSEDDAESKEEAIPSLLSAMRSWIQGRLKGRNVEGSLREALEEVIEGHEEHAGETIEPEERTMLQNILQFGGLEVRDVMIDRSDLVTVRHDIPLHELKDIVVSEGHTRLPVYRDNKDDMIGLVHIKDLIQFIGNEDGFDIDMIMRPLMAVPPSMKIVDLLMDMRLKGMHMVVVVDEYGGTDGIVTLEDLFEKIVGDIHDEYDEREHNMIFHLGAGRALIDARIPIRDLDEKMSVSLMADEDDDNNDYDTLGGFMFARLGYVPKAGEYVDESGYRWVVAKADARRILQVQAQRITRAVTSESRS